MQLSARLICRIFPDIPHHLPATNSLILILLLLLFTD